MFLDHLFLHPWIFIIFISLVLIASTILYKRKKRVAEFDYEALKETIRNAGYLYDSKQDIFYSHIDAWQRELGYCRLYDEAAGPMGIIIDCEPIFFQYEGRNWMIEFWKGQYGMAAGCEIGVYIKDDDKSGLVPGDYYQCVDNKDLLQMSCYLKKGDKILFERRDLHWWLTGFLLGQFVEPEELSMLLEITLKDSLMCYSFAIGLIKAGYTREEIYIHENTIALKFDRPHSPQPLSRVSAGDWISQKNNKYLCKKYQRITAPYKSFEDKARAINAKAPELFNGMIHLGKSQELKIIYNKIKDVM